MAMMIEAGALSSHTVKAANKTSSRKASAHYVQKSMIALCIPICFLGLIGNGTVVFLCCVIKKTKYTIYVLNIALADILSLLYHFTFYFMFLKPLYTSLIFTRIFSMINAIGYNSCFFILTLFCTERCLLVFFPVWSQHHQFSTTTACIILWTFSCFIAVVEFFVCQEKNEATLSCWSTVIFKMFVEFVIFFPALIFSTLALFIRTLKKAPQTPRARLDITVIAMSVHFLIFDISVRLLDAIVFWTERTDLPLTAISILCDTICNIGNPFIYLFMGYWKQPKACRPLHLCLERALDGNAAETTQANQEQA